MDAEHANAGTLRALIRAAGAQKQDVALHAGMSASQLSNVLSGRRLGTDPQTRQAIADGLSEVLGFPIHPRDFTCYCPEPRSHQS